MDELRNSFVTLRERYGSHGAAARILGISRDHYCALRNGRVPIPPRTAEYIILKAQEVSVVDTGVTCGREAVSV